MNINFNGNILNSDHPTLSYNNRGYKFGDGLFETLKVINGHILFWEDHYFRLMSSMRIMRMDIPMNFTMEFLEKEISKTIINNGLEQSIARVRLTVDRGNGGLYKPAETIVNYLIEASELNGDRGEYPANNSNFILDIYKDHFVNTGLLSTIKSNNRLINILGSIYATENDLNSCFLLNYNKSVIEALAGNIFLVNEGIIKTPPLNDGCLRGIMRKQIIHLIKKDAVLKVEEVSISPFELQKADEIFVTNVIKGIQSVTRYRKKTYKKEVANLLRERLNEAIREID